MEKLVEKRERQDGWSPLPDEVGGILFPGEKHGRGKRNGANHPGEVDIRWDFFPDFDEGVCFHLFQRRITRAAIAATRPPRPWPWIA
ncbi:MAG: hypothetical protein ACYDAG_09850 [Chloroflexota bacterium]